MKWTWHHRVINRVIRNHSWRQVLFKVWLDADFSGNWTKEDSMNDPETAKSGTVVSFMG
jgi:hypothetical protein